MNTLPSAASVEFENAKIQKTLPNTLARSSPVGPQTPISIKVHFVTLAHDYSKDLNGAPLLRSLFKRHATYLSEAHLGAKGNKNRAALASTLRTRQ